VLAIPQFHPPTAHLPQSDPRVDTVYILNRAARLRIMADMNACRLLDGDAGVHWPNNPVLNHYEWIWTGKRRWNGTEIRREMTPHEKRRPVDHWTEAEYLRWRRGPKGGRKPATVAKRQRQARRRGVPVCWELKTHDYGDNSAYAQRFVASVKAAGGTAFWFTLAKIPGWQRRMQAFHDAGAQTALDANGATRPDDLAMWRPHIDAIWGHWA
jgi:hypothetical protein